MRVNIKIEVNLLITEDVWKFIGRYYARAGSSFRDTRTFLSEPGNATG
jgi:hypothetical protein